MSWFKKWMWSTLNATPQIESDLTFVREAALSTTAEVIAGMAIREILSSYLRIREIELLGSTSMQKIATCCRPGLTRGLDATTLRFDLERRLNTKLPNELWRAEHEIWASTLEHTLTTWVQLLAKLIAPHMQ